VDGEALDLEAYLRRIGLRERPSLALVHRAHVTAIPFENLDPHRGIPVSLEAEAIQRKLVAARRGGYCFEHNLLLAAALRALGAEVEPLLARVRLGRPPGTPRPRTHLVLRVRSQGRLWLADAGFGGGTLLEPIPFGPGVVHEQSGRRYRIVRDGAEHVLLRALGADFIELYGFEPQAVPRIDIEVSNWFTCTHPRSPFVTGLDVAINRHDGSFQTLSDWGGRLTLSDERPGARFGESTVEPVRRRDLPRLLAARFGLDGFTVGPDGRLR